MAEVEPEELELLKRRANSLNLYINEHRSFDPCRGGSLYIMPRRKFQGDRVESLLTYATPEQCWEFFESYARTQ
jgi:hypothetical protein